MREEENRKLAEWLSPNGEHGTGDDWIQTPDFFTDEAANALLFDKVRHEEQKSALDGPFHRLLQALLLTTVDRKAAVIECALKLIAEEEG